MANKIPFKKLRDVLGPDGMIALAKRLGGEVTPRTVAKQLHEDNQFTSMSLETLQRMLYRYKKEEGTELVTAAAQEAIGDYGAVAALNVMVSMKTLIEQQEARLKKAMTREDTAPLLLKMVGEEMSRLLTMYDKLGKLQLETGVLVRAPRHMSGSLQHVPGMDGEPDTVLFEITEENVEALGLFDERFPYVIDA